MANETGLRADSTLRDAASGVPRLLIVDDDRLQASTLATLLREEGIDATWASPWRAVAESVLHSLDALILDVHKPGRHGIDVLAWVRERAPRLPTVVTSGLPEDDPQIMAAMALPPVFYLCKPFDLRGLLRLLHEALQQSSRHGARAWRAGRPVETA